MLYRKVFRLATRHRNAVLVSQELRNQRFTQKTATASNENMHYFRLKVIVSDSKMSGRMVYITHQFISIMVKHLVL